MINLFWKNSEKKIIALDEFSFKSEDNFEEYIRSNLELPPEIFITSHQIRSSAGKNIPDIIGIDSDNNVVIIEMKNFEVDENIIPQILRYAI